MASPKLDRSWQRSARAWPVSRALVEPEEVGLPATPDAKQVGHKGHSHPRRRIWLVALRSKDSRLRNRPDLLRPWLGILDGQKIENWKNSEKHGWLRKRRAHSVSESPCGPVMRITDKGQGQCDPT